MELIESNIQLIYTEDKELYTPPKYQLLKWVGSKHAYAREMSIFFPTSFNRYFEPFLGSGSILGTIAPSSGFASDIYLPLIDIWKTLKDDPGTLVKWYSDRRALLNTTDRKVVYENIKASFNRQPNAADFLYLTRSCWGGVIRFRKADGFMSTPIGYHEPITVESFRLRVNEWHERVKNTEFECADYKIAFEKAQSGDFIFCDPPYKYSQSILYGSQNFKLDELFECIKTAKQKGAYVAMSLDGNKKSGKEQADIEIPENLFERIIDINDRISMLLRFQRFEKKLTHERDSEKLFLTY